ncbi:MAG: methyl-accepting chemotaxis protein [Gammaproteobacteria bacterium]|nr:methyl-accepting chemotaxis protein [Gammaproteobacteria bacterium]MDH5801617.1 methyl-accepting chemotaxis protein [Gammaproteobacteria bacterium]
MKGFKKFSLGSTVSQRLNQVLGVMIAGFVMISLAFLAVDLLTTNTFKEDERVIQFATIADRALSSVQNARKEEKNFLLHKDEKYLETHSAFLDSAFKSIAQLDQITNVEGEHALLAKLKDTISDYQKKFKTTAQHQIDLGLNDKSGILGQLNESARSVEADLRYDGVAPLKASLLTMRVFEKNFLDTQTEEYISKMAAEQRRFNRLVADSTLSETAKDTIRTNMKDYQAHFATLVSGFKTVNADIESIEKSIHQADPLVKQLRSFLEKHQASNKQLHKTNHLIILIGFGVILILSAVAAGTMLFRVRKLINHSLDALQNTVGKMAEGDFSVRVDLHSKDEFGTLASAFNTMLEDRGKFMKTEEENEMLNNSIIALVRAVSKLGRGNLNSKAPVNEDITGALGDAINNMSEGIAKTLGNVDAASQQLIHASSEVRHNTEQSKGTVLGAAKGMSELRGTIQETAKRIKRLGERSQEIGGIIKLIDNIAERTNVLALNANMHAAAAGEAGRGFMVVADEVQRLAESSKGATEQIAKLVSNIQVETSDTISAMDKAIGEVVKGGEVTEQAAEQMDRTESTVSRLEALGQELASAVAAFELPENVVPMRSAQPVKMKEAS